MSSPEDKARRKAEVAHAAGLVEKTVALDQALVERTATLRELADQAEAFETAVPGQWRRRLEEALGRESGESATYRRRRDDVTADRLAADAVRRRVTDYASHVARNSSTALSRHVALREVAAQTQRDVQERKSANARLDARQKSLNDRAQAHRRGRVDEESGRVPPALSPKEQRELRLLMADAARRADDARRLEARADRAEARRASHVRRHGADMIRDLNRAADSKTRKALRLWAEMAAAKEPKKIAELLRQIGKLSNGVAAARAEAKRIQDELDGKAPPTEPEESVASSPEPDEVPPGCPPDFKTRCCEKCGPDQKCTCSGSSVAGGKAGDGAAVTRAPEHSGGTVALPPVCPPGVNCDSGPTQAPPARPHPPPKEPERAPDPPPVEVKPRPCHLDLAEERYYLQGPLEDLIAEHRARLERIERISSERKAKFPPRGAPFFQPGIGPAEDFDPLGYAREALRAIAGEIEALQVAAVDLLVSELLDLIEDLFCEETSREVLEALETAADIMGRLDLRSHATSGLQTALRSLGFSKDVVQVITDALTLGTALLSIRAITAGIKRAISSRTRLTRKRSAERSKDSVWNKPSAVRGNEIHTRLGENLPHTFPVVDIWNPATGSVRSIKSVDLTAKSYQNASRLRSLLQGRVDDVAEFETARLGRVAIERGSVRHRGLDVAVERGAASAEQQGVLRELQAYARSRGVDLQVHELD
jgi:hypothetical protein